MATKTNKSDVVSNFVRYHGRQPNAEELKKGGLIDSLTTKAPAEVEQLLSKNSPITGGKTWSEYQASLRTQEPTQLTDTIRPQYTWTDPATGRETPPGVGNPTPVSSTPSQTPAGTTPVGETTPATGATSSSNIDAEIEKYINSLGLSDEYKIILRTVAKDQYTTGMKINSPSDIDNIIKTATTNAEASLKPYYEKITTQDVEDLKKNMEDIRTTASNYLAQKEQSYADLLGKTKQSLRARGLTFSGTSLKQIGAESALQNAGIEGNLPTNRRLETTSAIGELQSKAKDTGIKAERLLGSNNATISNLGTIANPYARGNTYDRTATSNIYTPTGTTSVGDLQLQREKAIEERKQANLKALTKQYL